MESSRGCRRVPDARVGWRRRVSRPSCRESGPGRRAIYWERRERGSCTRWRIRVEFNSVGRRLPAAMRCAPKTDLRLSREGGEENEVRERELLLRRLRKLRATGFFLRGSLRKAYPRQIPRTPKSPAGFGTAANRPNQRAAFSSGPLRGVLSAPRLRACGPIEIVTNPALSTNRFSRFVTPRWQ